MTRLPLNTRITPSRKAMIDIFASTDHPLSAVQMHKLLKRLNINANITTVYRELEFLLNHTVIHKIDISGATTYYESSEGDHHHHAICTSCGNIQDVTISDEEAFLTNVRKPHDFTIKRHSVEFYGHCGTCN
ncbi:MAG: Fur family transcriptional regulator [bacterium]|nr:Fur family transcriptional regulator [bacterium]